MPKKSKYKILSKIGEEMLISLSELGDALDYFLTTPKGYYTVRGAIMHQSTYYSNLKRLEDKKLIQKTKTKNKTTYNITSDGKKLLKRLVMPKKRKDGMASVVIFDIPVEKNRARDSLRRYLIRNKYTQLQESVFISPNEFSEELKHLIKELKLTQNVTFMSSKVEYY